MQCPAQCPGIGSDQIGGAHLGAHSGAVHDGVAPVELVGIIHLFQPLLGSFISRVDDPPARQHVGSHASAPFRLF